MPISPCLRLRLQPSAAVYAIRFPFVRSRGEQQNRQSPSCHGSKMRHVKKENTLSSAFVWMLIIWQPSILCTWTQQWKHFSTCSNDQILQPVDASFVVKMFLGHRNEWKAMKRTPHGHVFCSLWLNWHLSNTLIASYIVRRHIKSISSYLCTNMHFSSPQGSLTDELLLLVGFFFWFPHQQHFEFESWLCLVGLFWSQG